MILRVFMLLYRLAWILLLCRPAPRAARPVHTQPTLIAARRHSSRPCR